MMSTSCGLVTSAIPHTDESFFGYLTRLAEINHYDTFGWILRSGGIRIRKVSMAFDETLDLRLLAQMTRTEETSLRALQYPPATSKKATFRDYCVLGPPVPRLVIRAHHPKVCPGCLREFGYVRKVWDLAHMTACPLHHCLLLDRCPDCEVQISPFRPRIDICGCESDWRNQPLTMVPKDQLELAATIHRLCSLPTRIGSSIANEKNNPLFILSLKDLFLALSFVACQFWEASHPKKRINLVRFGSVANAELHEVLCKALNVFREWPSNFFVFLDWRRDLLASRKHTSGLSKDFGPFKYALYNYLESACFDFMRTAFHDYIATRWKGGYVSAISRFKQEPPTNRTFRSKTEAGELLDAGPRVVDALLAEGALSAFITQRRDNRMILIEASSIERVKREFDDLLALDEALKRLSSSPHTLDTLVDYGLLHRRAFPGFRRRYGYSNREIENLLIRLEATVSNDPIRAKESKVLFSRALRSKDLLGLNRGLFITAILDGQIHPCGMHKKPGINSLLFFLSDIYRYGEMLRRKRYPGTVSIQEAADLMKTDVPTVSFLLRKKFISFSSETHAARLIPKRSLSEFAAKYVLASTVAMEVGTTAKWVVQILLANGIYPISRTGVDGGTRFVYTIKALDQIDLKATLEAIREQGEFARHHAPRFSIDYAAEYLQTTKETISQLVANGILLPLPGDGVWFSKHRLNNMRGKLRDYDGLLTASVAAKRIGRSDCNFRVNYLYRPLITSVRVSDDKRILIREADLEKLIRSEKQLVNSTQACEILDVSPSQMFRLVMSETLPPTKGPHVDGSQFNLFKRSDVENLAKDRRLFKRKRIDAGGSSRFGSPAGPTKKPVVDKIAGRVFELVASAESDGRRISVSKIHKQLLSEGYTASIVSVYVCLRKPSSFRKRKRAGPSHKPRP